MALMFDDGDRFAGNAVKKYNKKNAEILVEVRLTTENGYRVRNLAKKIAGECDAFRPHLCKITRNVR